MAEIFRASKEDWETIKRWAEDSTSERCILELRYRVAALESRAGAPSAPAATPHPDAPSDEELWELRRAAQQGRTSMENWITRAEIHGNRALFDAGVEWAPGAGRVATLKELMKAWDSANGFLAQLRAVYNLGRQHGAPVEQQAPAKPAAKPTPEPAPLPPLRVGQKWRRFDGKTTYVVSSRDSTSGYAFSCRESNDEANLIYTAEGKYINDSLPRGAYGYDLAELVEDAPEPAPAEPAPPAPAGGLVEEVATAMESSMTTPHARVRIEAGVAIKAVATWLERHQPTHETEPDSIDYAAYLLRQEANR